ncbi:MAG TPA: hypothetical protein VFG69_19825 [Nannocystaceae bacterium]|nr:hypothetical protein [Nannocystaceae bacterium]
MLVLALAGAASLAGTAGETVEIEWNAPLGCPSRESVDDALRTGLRKPTTEAIRVRADVAANEAGFAADVVVETGWGASRRHIEAGDCTSIADTTVLIAVIAADPLAIAIGDAAPLLHSVPPPSPAPVPASAPTIAEDPVVKLGAPPFDLGPEPAPVRARRRVAPPRGLVRIEGAFGLGLVPQPSGAVGGAIGVLWRHAELGITALWWPPRLTARSDSGAVARIGLVGVGPYGCGFLGTRAWSVGMCGAVEAGVMTGQGIHVRDPKTRSRPWVGLSLGPRLRWSPRPRIGLVAGLEGVAVVYRSKFVVQNEGDLYRAGIAGFRLRLGLEVRWP